MFAHAGPLAVVTHVAHLRLDRELHFSYDNLVLAGIKLVFVFGCVFVLCACLYLHLPRPCMYCTDYIMYIHLHMSAHKTFVYPGNTI